MKTLLTIFFLFTLIVAQEYVQLGNELDGVFDSLQYQVEGDIVVKEGKILEFRPGAVLSFNSYIGINVFGYLKMKDVTLKIKESTKKPWNGINVAHSGKIFFENVKISGSVFGIALRDSSSIERFINVQFTDNTINMRIGDQSVPVGKNNAVTIGRLKNTEHESEKEKVEIYLESANKKVVNKRIKSFRWISAATALTCSAVCTYSAIKSEQYYGKYENADNNVEALKYLDDSNSYLKYAIVSGIGAGIFGISLLVSLSF